MHSDKTYKTFRPSDFIHKTGLSGETVSKLERLGLISCTKRGGREKVYDTCDLIRVKLVIRCKKAGYSYKTIRNLIGITNGQAGESEQAARHLNFAQSRLNQIKQRINTAQGLDRLNLQLDEKLMSSYVKELSASLSPRSIQPKSKPIAVRRQPEAPVPRFTEYSQPFDHEHKKTILSTETKIKSYKWGFTLLTILVVGLTIFAIHLIKDDGTTVESYTATKSIPKHTDTIPIDKSEKKGLESQTTAKTESPTTDDIAEHTPTDIESPEAQTDVSSPLSEDKSRSTAPHPAQETAAKDSPLETAAANDLGRMISKKTDAGIPSVVESPAKLENVTIQNLNISFNRNNKILRATFNIVKGAAESGKVRGNTVLILKPSNDSPENQWLKIPDQHEDIHGKAWQTQGVPFSISKLKIQNHLQRLQENPDRFRYAAIQIYSNSGQLISQTDFRARISYEPSDSAIAPALHDTTSAARGSDSPNTDDSATAEASGRPGKNNPRKSELSAVTQPQDTGPKTVDEKTAKKSKHTGTDALEVEKNISQSKSREVKPTGNQVAKIWARKSYQNLLDKNYDNAIDAATMAIRLDPGLINPYISRAIAYTETGLYDEAIDDCNRALAMNPKNAVALNNRGLANQKKGLSVAAKSDYRQACDLKLSIGCKNLEGVERSEKIKALLNQSKKSFEDKDWGNVIKTTTEVLGIDADNVAAYTNRSVAYAQIGFLTKALEDGNMAIKLNPDFSLAYHNRGFVYERMDEVKKAAADYEKGCSLGLSSGCKSYERLMK